MLTKKQADFLREQANMALNAKYSEAYSAINDTPQRSTHRAQAEGMEDILNRAIELFTEGDDDE